MTGPEHYTQAERLLDHAPTHGISPVTGLDRAESFATAQVHATLALVAATLDAAEQVNTERIVGYPAEIGNWREVIA